MAKRRGGSLPRVMPERRTASGLENLRGNRPIPWICWRSGRAYRAGREHGSGSRGPNSDTLDAQKRPAANCYAATCISTRSVAKFATKIGLFQAG
jgi:hypothetical protein